MNSQLHARQAGFSMIEVAVAVAILGVLTISTLLTLIPVSRQTRLNREMEAAAAGMRDAMERVQATPFSELLTLYPDGSVLPVATLADGEITVSYADPAADPLLITFALTWDSPDVGPMERTYLTVRTE